MSVLNYHISIVVETELPLPHDVARMFLPNAKKGVKNLSCLSRKRYHQRSSAWLGIPSLSGG